MARAVKELFDRIGHDEFVDFAEARLPVESPPWARANLEYCRDVARGTRADDEGQTLSAQTVNAYLANPDDEQWSKVRVYESLDVSERSSAQHVWQAYQARFTLDAADTLVRRMAVEDLWHKCPDDAVVREMLMDVLWAEPDASIRMIAAMGLCRKCPTGDESAAAFIEQMAANEPNILLTRPVLE